MQSATIQSTNREDKNQVKAGGKTEISHYSRSGIGSDTASVDSSYSHNSSSKRSSYSQNTTTTVATSTASINSSPPPSPTLLARRRRGEQHQQEVEYCPSTLFVLPEQHQPRPPSISTVTALSETSEGENDTQLPSSNLVGEGEASHDTRNENMTRPMRVRPRRQTPVQKDNSSGLARSAITHEHQHHTSEDSFSISSMDVEMGMGSCAGDPPQHARQGDQKPQFQRWKQPSRKRFLSARSAPKPSVSSSISSSSFRSRRNNNVLHGDTSGSSQQRNVAARNGSTLNNNYNTGSNNSHSSSLRASLDAGMSAERGWIRSRGVTANSANNNDSVTRHGTQEDDFRPRNRSVTWQGDSSSAFSLGSGLSEASANDTYSASEEMDDLLLLDDLSTYTNNSSRTDDSHISTSNNSVSSSRRYRPASAPTISPNRQHNHHRPWNKPKNRLTQHFPSHPDTILEELDEGGEVFSTADLCSRQRSHSVPDGRRIPDFFLGPVPSTRYHAGSISGLTTPRQRRKTSRKLPRHTSETHQLEYNPVPQQNDSQQPDQTPLHARNPGFPRLSNSPRRPRAESEGTSLSSSAAAALNSNPPSQNTSSASSVSSFLLHDFSDAGASVATTATTPAESAIELVATPAHTMNNHTESAALYGSQNTPISGVDNSSVSGAHSTSRGADTDSNVRPPPRISEQQTSETIGDIQAPSIRSSNNSGQVPEAERQARIRWIRINRRFQFVITVVALLFSLLLFAILICWVVFTSAYVLSFEKSCDVHLKRYFWLVTLQLVLDVFRSDIMRIVFRWDPNSNQRIPARVILYNLAYLVYAILVLRLGVRSVFIDSTTCRKSAPELYNSSMAFVSLSLAAWGTIIFGYLIPFCVVAAMLTCNGYNPTTHNQAMDDSGQPVFPAAYATTGAPPGTIDHLSVVRLDAVREGSRECCICMEDFTAQDLLVQTSCKHIFHKQCCREWLRQARTCPVCRTDIPGSIQSIDQAKPDPTSRIPVGPTGRPVVGLFRILRSTTGEITNNM